MVLEKWGRIVRSISKVDFCIGSLFRLYCYYRENLLFLEIYECMYVLWEYISDIVIFIFYVVSVIVIYIKDIILIFFLILVVFVI